MYANIKCTSHYSSNLTMFAFCPQSTIWEHQATISKYFLGCKSSKATKVLWHQSFTTKQSFFVGQRGRGLFHLFGATKSNHGCHRSQTSGITNWSKAPPWKSYQSKAALLHWAFDGFYPKCIVRCKNRESAFVQMCHPQIGVKTCLAEHLSGFIRMHRPLFYFAKNLTLNQTW